jgi:hypothetical protein
VVVNGYLSAAHGSRFGGFPLPIFAIAARPLGIERNDKVGYENLGAPETLDADCVFRAGFEPLWSCPYAGQIVGY